MIFEPTAGLPRFDLIMSSLSFYPHITSEGFELSGHCKRRKLQTDKFLFGSVQFYDLFTQVPRCSVCRTILTQNDGTCGGAFMFVWCQCVS